MVEYHDSVVVRIQAKNAQIASALSLTNLHASTLEDELVAQRQENIDLKRKLKKKKKKI